MAQNKQNLVLDNTETAQFLELQAELNKDGTRRSLSQVVAYALRVAMANAKAAPNADFMINVIRIANEIQVPVLPVHDEVVFPETQLEIMKYVLARAFSWTFGNAGSFGLIKVKVTDSEMVEDRLELNLTDQAGC